VIEYDPTLGGCGVTVFALVVQLIGGCAIPSDVSVSVPIRPVAFSAKVVGMGVLYGSVSGAGIIARTAGLTINTPFV
jgi:hypothetical protein